MRGRTVAATVLLIAAALAVLGWRVLSSRRERQFQADLAAARAELIAGRHFAALERLQELVGRYPDSGEVQYLLGINATARGRPDQAEAAWARIRPGDAPHFGYAALHQAEVDQERGRLALAEDRLRAGLADPGVHRPRVRFALVRLLELEGRITEARRLQAEGAFEHPDPAGALRDLYLLERDPFPMEAARRLLESAARLAPDDLRVRLARAHLALREGRLDEAHRLIEESLAPLREDRAAWELLMEWGREAGRPEAVARALTHLPETPELAARALELRAWAAGLSGDRAAERAALEAWREREPTNPVPWERLAALAVAEGKPDEAVALRARRAELRNALKAYLDRLGEPGAGSDPGTLARLATAAGRTIDADFWSRRAGLAPAAAPPLASPRTLAQASPELVTLLSGLTPKTTVAQVGRPTELGSFRFQDDAEAVGLTFEHRTGAYPGKPIPPVTMGGGVALLDFDGDGWLDVYFVQSGTFPPPRGEASPQGDRLFRNQGNGRFQDATEATGLAKFPGDYGHGVTVGDIDNDGHPDLFVTRWRSYALYRNTGKGTFEDVTEAWGLGGDRDWPTSAAFADLDGDGDLDLYVCHYLKWDENDTRACIDPTDPTKYACGPRSFPALPDHLFRNEGGRFVDVTEEAGIRDLDGRGLGVVAVDADADGRLDLMVANDMSANYLWMNRGGLRFEERGLEAGVAGNETGAYQAGMGIACGDVDGDGRPDLAVTNYFGESTTLFRNLGGGLFADQSGPSGVRSASRYLLGFGAGFFDADADGRLDLLTANGHVHDGRPQFPWRMPAQLLAGRAGVRFEDVSQAAGEPFAREHLGRGLAFGDLDNDGKADAVMVSQDESAVYFHNVGEGGGRSLTLLLEGTASGRDAVGAVATAKLPDGRSVNALRLGGGSYQSASDPRLHLGLGETPRVEQLEVRWPSGRVERFGPLEAGAGYRLREGAGRPAPLTGWRTP